MLIMNSYAVVVVWGAGLFVLGLDCGRIVFHQTAAKESTAERSADALLGALALAVAAVTVSTLRLMGRNAHAVTVRFLVGAGAFVARAGIAAAAGISATWVVRLVGVVAEGMLVLGITGLGFRFRQGRTVGVVAGAVLVVRITWLRAGRRVGRRGSWHRGNVARTAWVVGLARLEDDRGHVAERTRLMGIARSRGLRRHERSGDVARRRRIAR